MNRYKVTNFIPLFFLILVMIVSTFLHPSFLTKNNLIGTIQVNTELGLLSIGSAFVILGGGIDLSVASILALASVMSMDLQRVGLPFAIIITLIVGAFLGFINGIIVSKAKLEPFIVTFATMMIYRAFAYIYSKGQPISPGSIGNVSDNFYFIGSGSLLGISFPLIIFLIIAVISIIIDRWTLFGHYIHAIGGNEESTRLAGVRTDLYKIITYTISGFLASLAGIIITARLGIGDPHVAIGYELIAITATIIGGIALFTGRGGIAGALCGILLLAFIYNIFNLLNINPFLQISTQGAIIIIAVFMSNFFYKTYK
ncbi:MAG: ABC transporter permease [Candidatus Humimicrobiaceae bacterium]